MKNSLKSKLVFSFLAVALIVVLVVSVVIRLTSGQSLVNLVVDQETADLTQAVQEYYASNGSMDGFNEYFQQNMQYTGSGSPPGTPKGPGGGRNQLRGVGGLVDAEYRAIFPTFGVEPGGSVEADPSQLAIPIKSEGVVIAYILRDNRSPFNLNAEEELFLKRTNLAIGLSALAGVLIAVAMGFLLASGILKPIRRLTRASRSLSSGALGEQVPVTTEDELGELTRTFNQMSSELLKADEQRKRLTADITHDLGTPLQVISGYVEMFEEDGVEPTPQRLGIIKTEVGHLRRLVSDLSMLTKVETGSLEIVMQPLDARTLIEQVVRSFQPMAARQGVDLVQEVPDGQVLVSADEGRMTQVLMNLVENALRYTPGGGKITLSAQPGVRVLLRVSDTGSGIEAEDLPYVFERFYRADKSRNANSGKSGLGLAICKALVSAQGGEISVDSAGSGLGTTFTINLASVN